MAFAIRSRALTFTPPKPSIKITLLLNNNLKRTLVKQFSVSCQRCSSFKTSSNSNSAKLNKSGSGEDSREMGKKIRNIGIMAHIDAGKTTTTERMLYYSGVIEFPGEVHHGDTVTDFLPQERERGITIQSAMVSFTWKDFRINLIDTPGHVDFTFEVERALRAVDSAVAIIDASAGVEAQTLTVWRQAMENHLPRLVFLNKMDKKTASYQMCLESIKSRLHSIPVLLQLPVYEKTPSAGRTGSGMIGITDLVKMETIIFDVPSKGEKFKTRCVAEDKDLLKRRYELIEQISDFDSDLATQIIETESVESVTNDQLEAAVKRVTLSSQIVPVFMGSSFKNVGVQPLLNGITTYLPHPAELPVQHKVVSAYGSELCSFVFKTLHDKQLGPLTFLRCFQGSLKPSQKIYNASREKNEKILKLYQPVADDLQEIDQIIKGQVAVVSGLKETFTGDTITSSSSVASAVRRKIVKILNDENAQPTLTGVEIPEPVFFCSIEPASLIHQKGLDAALEQLKREDPSLQVHVDPDTTQTVLSGMGELHLEIVHERLKREFKVDADMGKLQVAYKETISDSTTKRITFERRLADQKHSVIIELTLTAKDKPSLKFVRGLGKETQENLAHLRERHERCIQNGIDSSFRCGPKLSFPMLHVEVALNWFETTRHTSETIIEAAAASCIRQALQEASVLLLEPMVKLEIVVDENFQRVVTEDLNRRRFQMEYMDHKLGNRVISGLAPIGELMGYSTILRTLSSGLGSFSMQFSHYQKVLNPYEEEKIISNVRGF